MTDQFNPAETSSDYKAMLPYWEMVDTILEGAQAMRDAGEKYLPKFPQEDREDYAYRRKNAKFTNIYADIVENLAAKPFAEEVGLAEDADERFRALAEDIDGRGNNLHVFAASTFYRGINNAIDWILVDFTRATPREDGQPLSMDDEARQRLRPYWVHIPARRMLAVYSDVVAGQEVFVHARIREDIVRRKGSDEETIPRVRVLNREPITNTAGAVVGYGLATYAVWEQRAQQPGDAAVWRVVESGPLTIGEIALAPFITGRRKEGAWRFRPPMRDCAFLQVEHYQQETALKSIKELTAFPMLAANGVQPAMGADQKPLPVPVGPKSVLYAPPFSGESTSHGEWTFIEPTAASLKFLADDVKRTEDQLRELGRQPLTAQTGNLTVVTTAFAAQKGNSAVQAWALNLKDALEQAFVFTAKWLRIDEDSAPSVKVFSDFDIGLNDDKGPETLTNMRSSGPNGQPDISQRTLWSEMQRRGVLAGDFDADKEEQALLDEMPDDDSDEDLGAAAGTTEDAE